MKRRTAAAIVGLLVVICLVLLLSVAYPFSTSEPHAVKDEQFTAGEGDEYHVSGAITIDGDEYVVLEEAVVEDGARYQSLTVENVQSVLYQAGPCEAVYTRSEYPDEPTSIKSSRESKSVRANTFFASTATERASFSSLGRRTLTIAKSLSK
ncbi:hypothetical protein ACFQMM_23300 [Saliphagus sp. GCM10025308]